MFSLADADETETGNELSLSTYVWVLRLAYGWRWRVWSPSWTTMMEEKREGRMWQKQSTLDEVEKSRPISEKRFLGLKKRWENGARARVSTDLHSELKARRTSGSSETFIQWETFACNGKLVYIKYRWSRDWIWWKTCRTRQMRCQRWGARRRARRRRGRSSNPTSPSSPCRNFQFTVARLKQWYGNAVHDGRSTHSKSPRHNWYMTWVTLHMTLLPNDWDVQMTL